MRRVRLLVIAVAAIVAIPAPCARAQSPAAAQAPTLKPGDKVEVLWLGSWYAARVKEVRDGRYYVGYDGYASSWDEWVTPSRIRAVAPPAAKPAPAPAQAGKPAATPGAASKPPAAKPTAAKPPASGPGSASPLGRYTCQTWSMGAASLDNVGEFVLEGNGSYRDIWNKGSGRYTYDAKSRRIRFTSGPQKTDKAVITFDPAAGRGGRGRIEFDYGSDVKLHCYR